MDKMERTGEDHLLEICAEKLVKNGFDVRILPDIHAARNCVLDEIDQMSPASVSYGDSMTLRATGLIEILKERSDILFYDGFDRNLTREERIGMKRKALTADLFLSGANAITVQGSIHWLDMIGNRIAPIAFGPERVILLIGKNKLTGSQEEAMRRIKEVAAPSNAARHAAFNTPCIKTGECSDCHSPYRICNAWLTLDRCFPKRRILVLLLSENIGL